MMTQQEKIDFLKELIIELKGSKNYFEITEDTELYTVGLDSLDIVELQMMYEDKTKSIAKDPTTPINTVKDLIELMI
jgi:acyl carrier protein